MDFNVGHFFKMLNEYKSIVNQMFDNLSTNSVVATNYESM
jgi:hypothetical protein